MGLLNGKIAPDGDVDYDFREVGITQSKVDYSGNCGNISLGVCPFTIY
jgi:2-methylaconitate cis-trans-isomerase PrpF